MRELVLGQLPDTQCLPASDPKTQVGRRVRKGAGTPKQLTPGKLRIWLTSAVLSDPIFNPLWNPNARNVRAGHSLNSAGRLLVRVDDGHLSRPCSGISACTVLNPSIELIMKPCPSSQSCPAVKSTTSQGSDEEDLMTDF